MIPQNSIKEDLEKAVTLISEVYKKVYEQRAKQLENDQAAIGPNVFYLGTKKQLDLVLKKFGPRKPRMATAAMIFTIEIPAIVDSPGIPVKGTKYSPAARANAAIAAEKPTIMDTHPLMKPSNG